MLHFVTSRSNMGLHAILPRVIWTCVHVTHLVCEVFTKKRPSEQMFDVYYYKCEQRENKLTRISHTVKILFSIKAAVIEVWSMLHVYLYRLWVSLRNKIFLMQKNIIRG